MSGQRLGLTTYYRTISVDNKPTTVIIGPSKFDIIVLKTESCLEYIAQSCKWMDNRETEICTYTDEYVK